MFPSTPAVLLLLLATGLPIPVETTPGAGGRFKGGEPLKLYVSPDGNDAWSGRLRERNAEGTDGPLASLEGARNEIRRSRTPGPVDVCIQGGRYLMDAPFVLQGRDGGREAEGEAPARICYRAAPGERPVFSGGRAIRGWRRGGGSLWIAEIPEVKSGEWTFHQLFVNGRRAVRARSPNEGYYRTAGQLPGFENPQEHRGDASACMGFQYRPADLARWGGLSDVNLFLYHSWTSSLHWIRDLDEENRCVHFVNRCAWPVGWWERNRQRYHVENFLEALDQPGEWYLDRNEGTLYYRPLEGESMETAEVVAPVLHELVRLEGDPSEGPVRDVSLIGLSFLHSDWQIPGRGMADGQAATFLTGAIRLRHARGCILKDCEVAHVGTYGVWIDEGSAGNEILRCEIHDLGGGGVRIGNSRPPGDDDELRCSGNRIDNCFIHDGGRVFPAGCGVLIQHADHNQVTHNEICDFFYTGISIGWSWGYAESPAHHNIAEFNRVHHLGWGVLSDMGGIYTLGVSPGTRINHNVFHDIRSYSYGGWGLYTDEGSTGIEMTHNVVYNTTTGGFHQHYGRDNRICNNILAFSATHQLQRTREEDHNSFFFERNIVFFDNGRLFGGGWKNDRFTMDRNLYFDTSGKALDWNGGDLEAWRSRGHDLRSRVADPLFADPGRRDFRLCPGSPAEEIGFEPIDTSRAGLYNDERNGGDAGWADRPKEVERREMLFEGKR